MAESIYQESMGVTGLPGVQTSTRLVGTVSGSAPSTGTFSTSDFVVDQTGGFWVCSSGGTPGNWTRVNSNASVASVNLTAQTAAISPTTLYTTTTSGLFNISYYAKVTTPAGSSSNLGPFNVISTDPDGNAVTTVGFTSSQNSSVSGFISGNATIYVGSGTNIQYSLGYTSSGSPSMAYSLRAIVSSSVIAPSINAVNSFNGRTGTVVAASGDYTAAQGVLQTTTNVAGKNFVINGAMDFWQRGTSFGATNYAYTADRWQQYFSSTGGTVTQDSTLVPAGSQYAMRFTSSSSAWAWNTYQVIETKNTLPLAGKSVTVSYQAAGNATGTHVYSLMYYSTAVDASLSGGTWTACSITASSDAVVPASGFASGYNTFTVPSNAQTVYVQLQTSSTFNSGQYITVGQIQAEVGSAVTTFSRAGGSIGAELLLCQRYYQQTTASTAYPFIAWGRANANNVVSFWIPYITSMRANASFNYSSLSNIGIDYSGNATFYNPTAMTASHWSNTGVRVDGTFSTTAFTSNYFADLTFTSANAWISFSAEL